MLSNVADSQKYLIEGIKQLVAEAQAEGVVVSLSGGIDSTLAAWLAVQALGTDNVYGLSLPAGSESQLNVALAAEVARWLNIEHNMMCASIETGIDSLISSFETKPVSKYHKSIGNFKSRIRMAMLYYYTSLLKMETGKDLLVMGSCNRSEHFTGYFVKYGNRGVDFEPLGDLLKTEVFQMARAISGFPKTVLDRLPSARMWVDDKELDLSYKEVDHVIENFEYLSESKDPKIIEKTAELHKKSQHKREMPPSVNVLIDRVKGQDKEIPYEELDKVISVLLDGGFEEWKSLNKDTRAKILDLNEKARHKSTIPPIIEVTK
jgi:NAD+ synthase